jgi:hypothetical protein
MPDAPLPRRTLLALAAALAATPARADAVLADEPELLVAGPAEGRLAHWAQRLAAGLTPALPAGTRLRLTHAGGEDGVTGANQFATRVTPDGNTLLLLPGEAVLAWLAGDPRARFDAARWLAVMAGIAPTVVCGRPDAGADGARIRVGMAGPISPDLAALMGLELAGLPVAPVFGVLDHGSAAQALASRAVDAVLLRGAGVAANLGPLAQVGATTLFTLGAQGGEGRDALLPEIPNLAEYAAARGTVPPASLIPAWRAVAAAAQTEFALVLPQLTPASLVALWRKAGTQAGTDLQDPQGRTRAATDPQALAQALAPDTASLTALRGWLTARLNWAPG